MDEIMALAEERQLVVIEDCAQAHGATWHGRPVGAFGHAAAFSFCQDKIISTGGEGGMLVLDDVAAWKRAWAYKDIGRSYDAVHHREHPPWFRWITESFGSNWRLTEMQSAIGRLQLRKLPGWTARRQSNASLLTEGLSGVAALRIPVPPAHVGHAFYTFYAFLRPERLAQGFADGGQAGGLYLGEIGEQAEHWVTQAAQRLVRGAMLLIAWTGVPDDKLRLVPAPPLATLTSAVVPP
jgi:dTDP-4-amino-4,6-dideoxygalactose transaminase